MVAIVGNHPEAHKDPVFESDKEIWVLNGKGATLPRFDAVFQMHQQVDWGGQWSQRWLLENETVPIYMRQAYPDIPMSVAYPFKPAFILTHNIKHRGKPLKFFTGTFAWMLAMAVVLGKDKIEVHGFEMNEREYKEQSECFSFWLGFAAGRGMDVEINCADSIFDKPLYGAQPLQE